MEEYCPYVEQCDVTIVHGEDTFRYHDCRENVMRNLLNNILYIPSEDRFDLSILRTIQKFAKVFLFNHKILTTNRNIREHILLTKSSHSTNNLTLLQSKELLLTKLKTLQSRLTKIS